MSTTKIWCHNITNSSLFDNNIFTMSNNCRLCFYSRTFQCIFFVLEMSCPYLHWDKLYFDGLRHLPTSPALYADFYVHILWYISIVGRDTASYCLGIGMVSCLSLPFETFCVNTHKKRRCWDGYKYSSRAIRFQDISGIPPSRDATESLRLYTLYV